MNLVRDRAPSSDVDPFGDEVLTDPYPAFAALREAGPVVFLERYGLHVMARAAEVEAALRDHETYCSRRGVGIQDFAKQAPFRVPSLLLEADPPEHAAARAVLTGVLGPKAVKAMREGFTAEAERMVDRLVAAGRFDAVADLAEAFPLKVFPDQVGLGEEGRENLLPYGGMVFNAFGPQNAHFDQGMVRGQAAAAWIMEQTRHESLRPGGLGNRVHLAAAEAGFTDAEACILVRSFLSAGIDTTVHGLGNALLCLAEHPDQWALLHADPSLARAAFEESVRFESPVQCFFRTTTRAVEVAGTEIAEGEKVLLLFGAANRDPRRWEDPDRFDIARRAGGHVGFGAGIHACVGQMLARLEGECVLRALAERVATLHLDGTPERQLNNTLRGLQRLPLRVEAA